MDPFKVLGYEFEETEMEYTERDVALYALAVGSPGENPLNKLELPLVYNNLFKDNFKVLPTFAVLFPASLIEQFLLLEGLQFDPKLLLHGEHFLQLEKPLPIRAKIRSKSKICDFQDKGKVALIEVETISFDANSGEKLSTNRATCVLRGAGGFSTSQKSRGQISPTPPLPSPPKGVDPHYSREEKTQSNQALLYRLCGDYNPLHADPDFASDAGFPRPILHGLCTLGFVTRALLSLYGGLDPSRLHTLRVRFLLHVFPGETLVTSMWREGNENRIVFTCDVKERKKIVLRGVAEFFPASSRL